MLKSNSPELKLRLKLLIFILLLIWSAGIFLEGYMADSEYFMFAYPFVKKGYSLVCHQQTQKLIEFGGHHTLVCTRCTGIYLGALFSSLLIFFLIVKDKLKIRYLIWAAVPMLADVLSHVFGILPYNKTIVFSTGFLLGSAGFFYFYISLKRIIHKEE